MRAQSARGRLDSRSMSFMFQRVLRVAIFAGGLGLGVAAAVFGYSNPQAVTIAFGPFQWPGLPVGAVAIVALVAGVAAGYLYHLPARLHHVGECMRHRVQLVQLRGEIEQLRESLRSGDAESASGGAPSGGRPPALLPRHAGQSGGRSARGAEQVPAEPLVH